MKFSCVLGSCTLGLVSARNPYMLYGVPTQGPDIDLTEKILIASVISATVNNSSPSNITQNPQASAGPIAPNTPGFAEPCAIINQAVQDFPTGARKIVPAELAVQCLRSVPLDKDGNIKLIDELKLYLQWQSNIAYVKNPPAEYTELPVDLIEQMTSMQKQISSGGYTNEYDFQIDLNRLFNSAYDNHLAWQPDILATVFQFQRPTGFELVSVSVDGNELPEIFAYRDLELVKDNSSFKASPVRTINGDDARQYLQKVSLQAGFHDADTRFNALFPSQPLIARGVNYLGSFRTGMYAGPNTTLAFANGTTRSGMNLGVVIGNFTGVNSGTTFFKKFCSGPKLPTPTVPQGNTTASSPRPRPSHTGYPEAVILNPNLSIGGYYLNESGYEDVAILSIPSYESPDVQLFQNVMRDFIRMSVASNKTRLILDLRGNGGGNAILGYDSFKQLFPQTNQVPFGGTRYRAHQALDIIGKTTSDFIEGRTYVQSNVTAFNTSLQGLSMNDIFLFTTGFNFEHQLDENNKELRNWEQMFGPEKANNDNYTITLRYNFTDEASYTYPGFSVIGFLANANETSTPQPFEAENIVMLHDGMCSSTCAIVSELLKNQGGVRTIVIGGQPKFAPMQGVGGTKGAQVFAYDDIQFRSQLIYFLSSPEQQEQFNATTLGPTAFASQIFNRSAYTSAGQIAGGINLRDNLRQNDDSNTPLQFVYEAADCRMWYTADMVGDVRAVWRGVVDRMWSGQDMRGCVEGSTGDKSSVSGGGQKKEGGLPPPPKQAGAENSEGDRGQPGRIWWYSIAIAIALAF